MNIFDVIWVSLFLGFGAGIGNYCGGTLGSLIGGAIGFIAFNFWTNFNAWVLRQNPSCKCGNANLDDFSNIESPKWGHLFECNKCQTQYIMRGGNKWFEISTNNESKLFMKRKLNQKWSVVKLS